MEFEKKPRYKAGKVIGAYKVITDAFVPEDRTKFWYTIQCTVCGRTKDAAQHALARMEHRPPSMCVECSRERSLRNIVQSAFEDRLERFQEGQQLNHLLINKVIRYPDKPDRLDYECTCLICGAEEVFRFEQMKRKERSNAKRCAHCLRLLGVEELNKRMEEFYADDGECAEEPEVWAAAKATSYPELAAFDPEILRMAASMKW